MGTRLFNSTHHVPNLIKKKFITFKLNKGLISLKNLLSIEKRDSFFPKIFLKFSEDNIFLNFIEYSSKLKGRSSLFL